MAKVKSTTLYPHPFSKAYWRDAAAELKDTKMLVVTALMIALRVALKPLAIPLGPQLSIQTAMLATALGAMIFGPVVAIPAAMISDTVGFLIYPTGDYFLPFMLTEIASTMAYALCLYRAKPTTARVMIARFLICFLVNIVMQQFIYAWYYAYIGSPAKAKEQILGMMTLTRIIKNVAMFPIESVVLTLFLRYLMPVVRRAKLVYSMEEDMRFSKKAIALLLCLVLIGGGTATGYLFYTYSADLPAALAEARGNQRSRTADFSAEERVAVNHELTQVVLDQTGLWADETVVGITDSGYREPFSQETTYTVSVYVLDEEAFAAGQAAAAEKGKTYDMDTLWAYSKSGPKNDAYQSLVKVATAQIVKNEKTGEIISFSCKNVE